MSSQAESASGSGGLRVGHYELMTKIAAGGMGEIFIARRPGEEPVALKLLLPHLCDDGELVRMFLDEARLVARMHHPNIVQIRDLGQSDGRYFIAMELIEGVSLSTLLHCCRERRAQLPMPVVRRIADGLCAGLAYAHQLVDEQGHSIGVVHRDVTPHNILLSRTGRVCLTDFGIAKAQGSLHRTRFGVVRGKYAYIAPEQLERGGAVDARADLYAASVTLFEALTLVSPFSRETDLEIVEAVKTGTLPDAQRLRDDIPAELVEALQRGTQKDPADRFANAEALAEAWRAGELDGGSELGRWVSELCGDALRPFRGESGHAPIEGTRSIVDAVDFTHSVPSATDKAFLARRRWPLALVAFLTSVTSALVTFSLVRHKARPPIASVRAQPAEPSSSLAPTKSPATEPTTVPAPSTHAPIAPPERAQPSALPSAEPPPRPLPRPLYPERHATARSHALRIGFLTADATPWADLSVDGRSIERTPVSRYPLPVGDHTLTFESPTLGKKLRREVRIVEGQVARVRVTFPP